MSEKVRFISKCENQELKMVMSNRTVEHGVVVFKPGRSIHFVNHEYVTSDPEEIEYIRNHPFYGIRIVEVTASDQRAIRASQQANTAPTTVETPNDNDDGQVTLACGFVDKDGNRCDYVAKGKTEAEAQKRLTGHRTARGHHV